MSSWVRRTFMRLRSLFLCASLRFTIVSGVRLLAQPAFEFFVAFEKNLQRLGNDVRRGGVDELRILVELGLHGLLDARLNRYRLRLFGWCLNDRHVFVPFLLVGFVIHAVVQNSLVPLSC